MQTTDEPDVTDKLREVANSLRMDDGWNDANWVDAGAKEIEQLRAVVRKHEGWQSIETAPKDGTPIDLWVPGIGRVTEEWWDDDSWGVPGKPTHWMPLPDAPMSESASSQCQSDEKALPYENTK